MHIAYPLLQQLFKVKLASHVRVDLKRIAESLGSYQLNGNALQDCAHSTPHLKAVNQPTEPRELLFVPADPVEVDLHYGRAQAWASLTPVSPNVAGTIH